MLRKNKRYEVIVHTHYDNYIAEHQNIKLKRLKRDLRRFIKCTDVHMVSVGVVDINSKLLRDRLFIQKEKDIDFLC